MGRACRKLFLRQLLNRVGFSRGLVRSGPFFEGTYRGGRLARKVQLPTGREGRFGHRGQCVGARAHHDPGLNSRRHPDRQSRRQYRSRELWAAAERRYGEIAHGTILKRCLAAGLAWYQSDIQIGKYTDNGHVRIKTILLDQIFGFDPDVSLTPTNTFHVGFWFNNPEDAVACNFDASKPTPFNGEHKAGPVAMISLPDATTGLGPLCSDPNLSSSPATCNP